MIDGGLMRASDAAFERAADSIGCDLATIRAVFRVEAAGAFLDGIGEPIRRFEPHHFPQEHWTAIGFRPDGLAPWRASLAMSKRQRREMFEAALAISYEDACRAASWGAPQIMGFNHALCGYASAASMVTAFRSPDIQVAAFARFCVNKGLGIKLVRKDWLGFATGYNGPGQAEVYAAKIAEAYERELAVTPAPPERRWDGVGWPEEPEGRPAMPDSAWTALTGAWKRLFRRE